MPNFVSFVASIAELAHEKKSRTQSLDQSITQLACSITHSASLFDAPGTEACASKHTEQNVRRGKTLTLHGPLAYEYVKLQNRTIISLNKSSTTYIEIIQLHNTLSS